MLGGWIVLLALVVLGAVVSSCAGPRVDAVEAAQQETVDAIEATREQLDRAPAGSPEFNALLAELAALRERLVKLEAERLAAFGGDTRDGIESTLWELAELLLVGGGVGYGINRHRSKTRALEMAALQERLDAIERARG